MTAQDARRDRIRGLGRAARGTGRARHPRRGAPAPEPGRPALAVVLAAALCLLGPGPAAAQDTAEAAVAGARGPVTGLPLPRFVSLRASEARARRGPGMDHRVDWLYRRSGLPLRVTAEHGHWRRVEDIEGAGGWVHYSLISGTRTVIVTAEMAELRRKPDETSPLVARLEAGVLASLGECEAGWCQLRADGHRGWAAEAGLWGSR